MKTYEHFFENTSLNSSFVSDESCRENQNTQLFCQYFFFLKIFENRAFCEIIWKSIVEADRPQTATQHNTAHALCMVDN